MMSTLRAVGLDELETVTNALRTLGATGITVDVLGSVGHEYAYAVSYTPEGSDDGMWATIPRIQEIPVIDDDATVADTREYEFGTIDREAA